MKTAIISDIHGNVDALQAVLLEDMSQIGSSLKKTDILKLINGICLIVK